MVSCAPAAPTPRETTPPAAFVQRVETAGPAPAFADPDRRAKLQAAIPSIEAYLQSTVERDRLVGLAAGVVIDDELVWSRGWGFRDPARQLPVTSDTAFGIGSITKPIVALAVMMLRDRGAVDLDRPAHDFLPALAGVVYPTADSPAITIRHLLTHTSGLPRMGDFPEYPSAPQSRADFLAALDGLRLDRPPGVRPVYSNLGFQVLGQLVGEVTREDHRTFIRREILEPVGLAGAGWTPEEVGLDRVALPHDLDANGEPRLRAHWTPGAADAAGGLYASIEDLAAFAAWNLSAYPPGREDRRGPLRAATIREAHATARVHGFEARRGAEGEPATARMVGGGLGFAVISTCRHTRIVAHGGKTMGHRASLHMLPDHGVAVVLLTNLSGIHSSVLPADGEHVIDLLADTGALQPRVASPTAALLEGARSFAALLTERTPVGFAAAFSPDFRDRPDEIDALLEGWPELAGRCEDAVVLEAEEAYAGKVELACERGALQMIVRVAPWDGHPITSVRILGVAGIEASDAVVDAAKRVTGLLRRWDDDAFAKLFVRSTNAARMRERFTAVGACELGDVRFVEPRGATFDLRCAGGDGTMRLALAEDGGLVEQLDLRDDAEGPCR